MELGAQKRPTKAYKGVSVELRAPKTAIKRLTKGGSTQSRGSKKPETSQRLLKGFQKLLGSIKDQKGKGQDLAPASVKIAVVILKSAPV